MMSKADEDKVGMESLWLSVGSVNIASHEGFVGGVFWSVVVLIRRLSLSLFSLFALLSLTFSELVRHARRGGMVGGVLQKGTRIAGSRGRTLVLDTEGQRNESHVANESAG